MKITVTVDCTPEEARAFLGFPDMSAIQQQMLGAMQEQFRQQMSVNPEVAMKSWFGTGLQELSEMQRNYWQQMLTPTGQKNE
jgi:hypothetical protein